MQENKCPKRILIISSVNPDDQTYMDSRDLRKLHGEVEMHKMEKTEGKVERVGPGEPAIVSGERAGSGERHGD